jgi:glycosyltransferase involved in cell wall biosynthesis
MPDPLVSIVMPAYNAAAYIAEALGSCLAQTWKRLEVIVVDDGSTDRTLQIARSFEFANLKVVAAEHRGQSAAINRGLQLAQGDLLKTFDADDVLPAECVALQVDRIRGRDDVVATGSYRSFRGSIAHAEPLSDVVCADMSGFDWLMASLCPDRTAGHSSRLVPRRVLERAGPWDERLSLHNDYEIATRIMLGVREVRYTPGAYYYCRYDVPASLSRRRTSDAIASAALSVTLVVEQLLRSRDDSASRQLCANLLQTFAYSYHAESPERAEQAAARARALGRPDVAPEGALGFQIARSVVGWRLARRLERWAVRHGLNRGAFAARARRLWP